jgi:predicted PurR-regulated permease PerM/GAF domain-containing protein
MPAPKIKTNASDALVGIWAVALSAFVLAMLYFGRDLLIPLALSALLTFLLAPLVTRLERWIGRILAVLLVVALIFTGLGAAGWMLTRQLVDLATKLPEYKGNIVTKLHAFDIPKGGAFSKLWGIVEDLKKELPGGAAPVAPAAPAEPARQESAVETHPAPALPTVPVKVVESSKTNPLELVRLIVAPMLGPLGMAALVVLLVICMLFQREDLRSRLIRLVGQGHISATTRAMDDAGRRVSRYLLMQFLVNVTYGTVIAIGLYVIGVPNAVLWGAFGAVLRFIPYIGPWIAAAFPTLLALAVSPHWTMPLLTIALFALLELLLNNVMEPLLYGAHTGVSSIALIVAAVFWTWMWGPLGLVLATPLTVCLVVMGRHVPRLSFLSIVLSDEEALTPAEDCYHRLLTPGESDEWELVESYLKTHSLAELYDSVLIPVLTAVETDARAEMLDPEQLDHVEQSMRDIIEDLGTRPVAPVKAPATRDEDVADEVPIPIPAAAADCRIYCLPARAQRDELAGAMLTQLARQQGFGAQNASAQLVTGELLELAEKADVDVVCISAVAPSTVIHARYLCLKLRALLPRQKIVIGLWGVSEDLTEATKRLRDSGADEVVTTLAEALVEIPKLVPPITEEMTPAPLPADEEERLAALAALNLLDTEAEPFFDRITTKLARVFEVPIALITFVDRDRQFFKSQTGLPPELAKARQTPRNVSACGHVVAKNQVIVIEDLARDRRFANNPLFKEHGIRFYAGIPLLAPNGQPIGSLCLMDMKPRQLSGREKRLLQEYASEVMEEIARRVPASPPSQGEVA